MKLITTNNNYSADKNNYTNKKLFTHFRFLKDNPDHHQKYTKLSRLNIENESILENSEFESTANRYFQVFDDVMSELEANPGNMDSCINKLINVGKKHKKVSGFSSGSFQVS